MALNPKNRRPEFKLEISGGKLILQTRIRSARWTWLAFVIAILIVLAILQPEGWLDILRAILLILDPLIAGVHRSLLRYSI